MTFSAIHVSNSIIKRSFADDISLTPMKLQRILYFVASEYAKRTGVALFDEQFMLWQYGPVVQTVYDKFSCFKGNRITKYAKDAKGNGFCVDETRDDVLSAVLTEVWDRCKNIPAVTLSRVSVMEGSGWNKSYIVGHEVVQFADMVNDYSYYHVLGFVRLVVK